MDAQNRREELLCQLRKSKDGHIKISLDELVAAYNKQIVTMYESSGNTRKLSFDRIFKAKPIKLTVENDVLKISFDNEEYALHLLNDSHFELWYRMLPTSKGQFGCVHTAVVAEEKYYILVTPIDECREFDTAFPGYFVNRYGNVFVLPGKGGSKKHTLTPLRYTLSKGYERVVCTDANHKRHTCRINRLVAKAYIPNFGDLPEVNHKDEDKRNNCVDNLEWISHEDNMNCGTVITRISETLKKTKAKKQAEKPTE